MLAGFLRGVFLEEPSLSRTLRELSQPDKASPFRQSSHPPYSPLHPPAVPPTPAVSLSNASASSSCFLRRSLAGNHPLPSRQLLHPSWTVFPRHGDEALIAGSQSGTSIVASKARFHASNNRLAAASSSFSPSSFARHPRRSSRPRSTLARSCCSPENEVPPSTATTTASSSADRVPVQIMTPESRVARPTPSGSLSGKMEPSD